MLALDLLGAGEGLSTQTVLVRVRKIDVPKLKENVKTGSWGALFGPALAVVDQFPKLALDLALPIAQQQLAGLGITADVSATDAPPPPRPPAESKSAFVVGAVLGALLVAGGGVAYRRLTTKTNTPIAAAR